MTPYQNGTSDACTHTARAKDTQNRCDQMNYEDYQMAHGPSYQSLTARILG